MRPQARPPSAGANEGWAVMTTLIGGFLVWGGIGWLLDHWWGTRLMTPIGLILGMALGIYAVVAKFGKPPADRLPTAGSTTQVTAPRAQTATPRTATPTTPTIATPTPTPTQRRDGPPPASTRRENECP